MTPCLKKLLQTLPTLVILIALNISSQTCRAAVEQPGLSLAERLDAQHKLFDRYSDDEERDDGELENLFHRTSLADLEQDDEAEERLISTISSIRIDDFPEDEQLSHELLIRELKRKRSDFHFRDFEMPFGDGTPLCRSIARVVMSTKLETAADYRRYIASLELIPRILQNQTFILRRGIADGLTSPRELVTRIPGECLQIAHDDPFDLHGRVMPATLNQSDRRRIAKALRLVVDSDVLPAFQKFAQFLADDYIPAARTSIGMIGLPDGYRRYERKVQEQTTTKLSPDQVHQLGLSEVSRIEAQLAEIAVKAGFPDLSTYRAALNADPRYIPTSSAQIVADFQQYVQAMQPRLPELFYQYPTSALVVEADSAATGGFGTHHVDGSPDGSVPGKVVVAVSDFASRRLISDETQAYHEGLPGHELQITFQNSIPGLPSFRRDIRYTAYVEGWAVYAEALGKDIGFFRDPASDYGRLNLELLRAVRLVVDTGINAEGWDRERAAAYLRASGSADEPTIQSEIDRYIAWPGQSLAYKIGQLTIFNLRERARRRLGPRFDIKEFHQKILEAGSLPLDLLEDRVDNWLNQQCSATSSGDNGSSACQSTP